MPISTHAPLAGCDVLNAVNVNEHTEFLPTHPLRGATVHGRVFQVGKRISTHAPLAGCDRRPAIFRSQHLPFLPTHPLRGATRAGGRR